jgi:hypothetical protein
MTAHCSLRREARPPQPAVLLPALVALAARMLTRPHAIDDAYITFRYARNLADGLGLVYNPGDWVLGTTAPLWALILAGGYRLGLTDLPWLATALSALCDAATAALIVHFCMRMGWRPLGAALVGLAWALNPMSIAFATGGMETSLFVLLSMAVLSLSASGKSLILAAVLGAAATFVRPEGGFLAAALIAWTFFTKRSQTPQVIAVGGLPVALAGAAIFLRYGSPLPNSVAAKQVAYQPAWPLENAVALLVQAGLPGWSTYLLAVLPAAVGLLLALLGLAALIDLARRAVPWLNRRDVRWQPFAGFALLYLAFYVVAGLRGVRLFPWYLVPIEPFYLLTAAAGLARFGTLRTSLVALALVAWQVPAIDWRQPLMPLGEDLGREQLYLDVGHALATSLPPDALIAAPEIGALGYASNLRVLDTVGLISPTSLPYYPLPAELVIGDNAIPPRLIADRRPDAVVTLDGFAARSLLPDPEFQRDYRLEATYPAAVWQSHELLLFRRVDR